MHARRDAIFNRRSEGQVLGGKGSGGGDCPCSMADRAGQTDLLACGEGRTKVSMPRFGGVATHACTQLTAACSQGPASHSGQCLHGSEAAVCTRADAIEMAGNDAARTARHPSRRARARKRFMV